MLRRMLARSAVTASVMTAAVLAQQPSVDVTRLGPQVGSGVVDFSLKDPRGQAHSIRSTAGPKGTMLVFFRSADW